MASVHETRWSDGDVSKAIGVNGSARRLDGGAKIDHPFAVYPASGDRRYSPAPRERETVATMSGDFLSLTGQIH
jgi:hypothetical protein